MSTEKITLDSFRPFVQAAEAHERCADAYWTANKKTRELLNSIKNRQAKERQKLSVMLKELKAEEIALRRKVRDEAADRAKAILTGKEPKETDITAGARLAALPDEMDALEAMIAGKRMTDEEKELWEQAISELSDSTSAYQKAFYAYREEAAKWVNFFKSEALHSVIPDILYVDRIAREGYALNKDDEEEAEESIEDEEDEAEDEDESGDEPQILCGRILT